MQQRSLTEEEMKKVGKLFSIPLGKDVLQILDREFFNQISYVNGNQYDTVFNEGCRYLIGLFHNAKQVSEAVNED